MMEDRKESQTKPFEELKDSLKKQLSDKLAGAKANEFIKKTNSDAGSEIYVDKITAENK